MTAQRKAFVNEYLKDKNATKAAIRAKYSARTAPQIAVALMKDPEIQGEIDRRMEKCAKKVDVGIERILLELAAIAFTNTGEIVDNEGCIKSNLSEEAQKAIASIKMTRDGAQVSTYDKMRALELLGKYNRMFVDKTENVNVDMTLEQYLSKVNDEDEY